MRKPRRIAVQDTPDHRPSPPDEILQVTIKMEDNDKIRGHHAEQLSFTDSWLDESSQAQAFTPLDALENGLAATSTATDNDMASLFGFFPVGRREVNGPPMLRDSTMDRSVEPAGEEDAKVLQHHRSDDHNNEKILLEQMVDQDIGSRLIELFMRFINPLFPVFADDSLPRTTDSPAYLLAAIYLLTALFFIFDRDVCVHVLYSRPDPKKLFRIAWHGFLQELQNPSVASLQTALLLLLSPPLEPLNLQMPFKCSLAGTMVSIAETLGFHLDPTDWGTVLAHEIQARRRLSWVIYTVDTWLALSTGRPPRISKDNWIINSFNSFEEQQPEGLESTASPLCVPFSRLTNIANTILNDMFSLTASRTLTADFWQALETVKPLVRDLYVWQDEHATSTQSLRGSDACQQRHLRLAYHGACMAVIRALLRTFDDPEVESKVEDESDLVTFLKSRELFREDVKTSLVVTINFVSSVTRKDLHQFWPHWSTAMISQAPYLALLAMVTSRDAHEAGEFKWLLSQLRQVLESRSEFCDMLKLASLRLDAHLSRGFDNVLTMDQKLGLTFEHVIEVPVSMDVYVDFGGWFHEM